VGNPPHAWMKVLKLIIGPRWIFLYPGLQVNLHYGDRPDLWRE
jgi:hypothetical protein